MFFRRELLRSSRLWCTFLLCSSQTLSRLSLSFFLSPSPSPSPFVLFACPLSSSLRPFPFLLFLSLPFFLSHLSSSLPLFPSQLRCKCGSTRNSYEPFLDLSLEISEVTDTLQEMLGMFYLLRSRFYRCLIFASLGSCYSLLSTNLWSTVCSFTTWYFLLAWFDVFFG